MGASRMLRLIEPVRRVRGGKLPESVALEFRDAVDAAITPFDSRAYYLAFSIKQEILVEHCNHDQSWLFGKNKKFFVGFSYA